MSEEEEEEESNPSLLESDLADLRAFVYQLLNLLQAIVDDGRHIPDELRDDVRASWHEAKADFDALLDSLVEPSPDTNEALKTHGLTGTSLRMKLRGWRSRVFAFGRRMNRRWLRSALRWSDTLLGSLVDALTLGAAGKEFKEAIENFLEDAEADGQPEPQNKRRS